jgi:hypothetical protein
MKDSTNRCVVHAKYACGPFSSSFSSSLARSQPSAAAGIGVERIKAARQLRHCQKASVSGLHTACAEPY